MAGPGPGSQGGDVRRQGDRREEGRGRRGEGGREAAEIRLGMS